MYLGDFDSQKRTKKCIDDPGFSRHLRAKCHGLRLSSLWGRQRIISQLFSGKVLSELVDKLNISG